jgi:serine/threonine protein kinase
MSSAPSKPSHPGMPAPPSASSIEETLPRQFGKYTLLRAIASGGMAKVYLAIQRAVAGFEKLVVIKRILPELSADDAFVEMLLSEARIAATLNHPNVVQTFDVGEVEGTYYIAMEHINGEDIRSIVRAMKRSQVTEFPIEHTLSIILGMCAGLAYAHDKKDLEGNPLHIVHRDISPQNALITFTGDVKIVDFGIAKTSEVAIGERTQAGQLKGKVPYMSPEQAAGKEIDNRSDIFAVGIMLFELTTGRRLFKAKSEFETLKLICDREYPRPSQIRADYPPGLEAIVMKALTKEPDARYQSARDMQADLEAFIREERIAASAVSLGIWMKMLFEDKILEQKEALQDVKHLADVIASQRRIDTDMYASTSTTTGAATITGTDIGAYTMARRRSNRVMMVVGVAVVAAVAAAAGLFIATRPLPPETKTATSVAPREELPPEKKGSIKVSTKPEGAYVRIAGELQAGKTPLTIDKLPLGSDIEVKISLDGYEMVSKSVHLTESSLAEELDVKMVTGSVVVNFTVSPKGAVVYVDDKRWKGTGNTIEELSTGKHKLVFAATGHIPQTVTFSAKKGEVKKLEILLKKGSLPAGGGKKKKKAEPVAKGPPGTVRINSRGGFCASTIVNGRNFGPTPTVASGVGPGPVSILCKTGDGRTAGGGANVPSGGSTSVTISIPKKK